MPSPNPATRREHAGAAVQTTLATSMSSLDTSFQIASGTGWPTGAVGVFFVVVDPGTSTEEKILCSSRTATVVTVAPSGRGADSTVAASHALGATCYPCWTATEADELNAHANASTGVHNVAGAVVGTTDGQVLTNKTIASASNTITVTGGAIDTVLAGKQASGNYITALTGDVTATGPGSVPATLPVVNANVGSFGSATSVMTQTVNAKGLTTAAASVPIAIPESQVTNLTTDLAAKQPLDGDLTALAALAATGGMLARTGANAFAVRTIVDDGVTTNVNNGDGVAGAPAISVTNTGVITAGFTVGGVDWTVNTASYRIVAGLLCFLHIQCTYSGSSVAAGSGGNLTDLQPIIIPAAIRPNRDLRCSYSRGNSANGTASVGNSGSVQIETLSTGSTLTSGDAISIDFMYALTS